MSASPPVSVIIVSRGRPEALKLCLTGLARLQYDPYELIVVADDAGVQAANSLCFRENLRILPFDQANISAARNLGIAHAAGQIVAFIDDDSVPEPLWLHHLTKPFEDRDVAAVGGYVRGRNGISFQWRGRVVNGLGETREVEPDTQGRVQKGPGEAVKLEGTNMAFRRDILLSSGGFDPVFRFYKDETDLCLRLTQAGHETRLAPLAEVHHAYAESGRRGANRGVRDLTQIAASTVVFLRKHAAQTDLAAECAKLREGQHKRLLQQMVDGQLEPRDIAPALESFDRGCAEGLRRELTRSEPISPENNPFLPFPSRATGRHHLLAGRVWAGLRLRRRAKALAGQGHTVSVMLMTHTALFHRLSFHPDGYWLQRGGLFGRADRKEPLFRLTTLPRRIRAETARISPQRGAPLS